MMHQCASVAGLDSYLGSTFCQAISRPCIEPLGMIGVSVTMMKRDRVARSGRHDPRARVAELADAQDLGSCPARGEGSNPSSRTPPSEAVRLRQNHANYKGKPSSTSVGPIPSSRQYPNESGSIRP